MPASSVAVTNFSLKAKSGTKVKLDSVFFSIDLNRGVIFNADSLPVGTDITKLVPVISYTSSASAVTLTQSGGKTTGEIDYKTNPSDTVDFSGKVVLKITAYGSFCISCIGRPESMHECASLIAQAKHGVGISSYNIYPDATGVCPSDAICRCVEHSGGV